MDPIWMDPDYKIAGYPVHPAKTIRVQSCPKPKPKLLSLSSEKSFRFIFNLQHFSKHGFYIKWYLENGCARKEQSVYYT